MARCSNCKAPLADGSIVCDYCGNRNDLDLQGVHYYTTHPIDQPRFCPRCNEKKLATLDLKLNGTFLIERCDSCLGLFFDPGELEAVLEATVSNVSGIDRTGLDQLNAQRRPKEYPVSYLKCPVCSQLMNRVNFGAKSGVIADRCKAHGLWLDGGELRHLQEWMKLGGKMLDQERQHQQQLEDIRRERETRDRQTGGAYEPSPFDGYGDVLRNSDPDLFDIVFKALRIFTR